MLWKRTLILQAHFAPSASHFSLQEARNKLIRDQGHSVVAGSMETAKKDFNKWEPMLNPPTNSWRAELSPSPSLSVFLFRLILFLRVVSCFCVCISLHLSLLITLQHLLSDTKSTLFPFCTPPRPPQASGIYLLVPLSRPSPTALRLTARYRALWVSRKRSAMDVVDMISDGMEKKPKQVMVRLMA